MDIVFWLIVVSTIVHGTIAGLSFDVALVKLPTRKRIGAIAYANFARGNDLGNGIIVYPSVGILALLLVIATILAAYSTHAPAAVMLPLYVTGLTTICHTLGSAKAAPIMLSLKHTPDDTKILTTKLNAFARWHAFRAVFQMGTFIALVWTLVIVSRGQ